ncbi:MAG: hypothetical protein JMDDDDMK_03659 [Acidobacteria bacterium]|nr:hypothetical protein [Acidobacteriota bacterium]
MILGFPATANKEDFVPGTNSQRSVDEMKEMFEGLRHYIPIVVCQACNKLRYHPGPMELDGLEQRVALTLIDNDYRVLRSFAHQSDLQTWLYTIAKRKILQWLQEQKKMSSLEDWLQDALTFQSDQEQKLILQEEEKEREKILLLALSKLTEHEQKLFSLMRQGLKTGKIAKEMGIKKESAYTEISVLKKKLRKIIERSREVL